MAGLLASKVRSWLMCDKSQYMLAVVTPSSLPSFLYLSIPPSFPPYFWQCRFSSSLYFFVDLDLAFRNLVGLDALYILMLSYVGEQEDGDDGYHQYQDTAC